MPKVLQRRFPLNKFTVSMALLSLISVVGEKPKIPKVKQSSVLEHSVQAFIICKKTTVKLWKNSCKERGETAYRSGQ